MAGGLLARETEGREAEDLPLLFKGADMSGGADIGDRSLGLMRTVLTAVAPAGTNLTRTNLGRFRLEFANLTNAEGLPTARTDIVCAG